MGTIRLSYEFSFTKIQPHIWLALEARMGKIPTNTQMEGSGRFDVTLLCGRLGLLQIPLGCDVPVGRDDADIVRDAADMEVLGDLLFVEEAVVATAHSFSVLVD